MDFSLAGIHTIPSMIKVLNMDTSSGESTPTKQNRSSTGRAPLPRRSTRGPLDISQVPISTTSSPSTSQILPPSTSPQPPVALSTYTTAQPYPTKEFPKLLRPEIYHPLTHLSTPAPFRTSAKQPSPDTPLPTLLLTGHFRSAAITAAHILTTSTSPTDHVAIFSLLYTRLACLTLCGSTALAAQEATALEDLNSSIYRDEETGSHLLPWELRVLAVRLQGVGFKDPRKIIMGYYDLARQARLEITRLNEKGTLYDESQRELWETRLADLGLRVASSLVEMEDYEGATHHLRKLSNSGSYSKMKHLNLQKAILWLRIGDVEASRSCLSGDAEIDEVVAALSDVAEGNYGTASNAWKALCDRDPENAMYRQNLAVCLLYAGRMDEARTILEGLVHNGNTFHALTFNLCTIYELCTDRSRAFKINLAEEVADMSDSNGTGWEKSILDFKL